MTIKTKLDTAVDADKARDDAITVYEALPPGDDDKRAKLDKVNQKTDVATKARKDYVEELAVPRGNMFDLDPAEEFYVSTEYGNLRGPTGSSPKNRVSLDDLNTSALAGAQFTTYEGDRYTWTKGNTYTFGGGNDYSFANGYSVSMSYDAIDDEDFETWDGQFPYDIFAPSHDGKEKPGNRAHGDHATSFDKLPKTYKVESKFSLGYEMPKPISDVNFGNNSVGKNIGHTYGYQLGDTYSVQLSKNTHSIQAVDNAYSYEAVQYSENISHKRLGLDLNAHLADVSFGVKGLDVGFNATAVSFDASITGLNVELKTGIMNFKREKFHCTDEGKKGDAIAAVTGLNIKFSLDNVINSAKETIYDLSTRNFILASDEAHPAAIQDPLKALNAHIKEAPQLVPPTVPPTAVAPPLYNSLVDYVTANQAYATKLTLLTKNLKTAISTLSTTPITVPNKKNYSSIETTKEFIELKSNKTSGNTVDLNLHPGSSDFNAVLSARPHDKERTDASNNASLTLNTDKGSVVVQHSVDAARFYKIWATEKSVTTAPNLNEKTVGLIAQEDANKFAKLELDSKKFKSTHKIQKTAANYISQEYDVKANKAVLEVNKDATNFVKSIANAAEGTYSVEIEKGNYSTSLELKGTTAALIVNKKKTKLVLDGDDAKLEAETTTVEAPRKFKVNSPILELGKVNFKDTSVTIPQANVTLGAASKVVVTAECVDIQAPKLAMTGTAMVELKAAMVKLG